MFLGHTSSAITQGHYIEPDHTVDLGPAECLERTLRPVAPEVDLLAAPASPEEEACLADFDEPDDDAVA
jgi:hypothetical protein